MLLKQKFNTLIFLTGAVAALLVYVASIWLLENYLYENAQLQRDAVTQSVMQDIEVFDRLQQVVEKQWENELENALRAAALELQQSMNNGSLLNQELIFELKEKHRLSDLHIIDSELLVSLSTFAPEVGLDMKGISDEYTQSLRALVNKDAFMTHGTSLSTISGRLKKYGYYSASGSNIIVNGDFDVRHKLLTETDNDIAKYVYGDYVQELTPKYPNIQHIDLFILTNSDSWSLFNQGNSIERSLAQSILSGDYLSGSSPHRILKNIDMQSYRDVGLKVFLDIQFDGSLLAQTKRNLRLMSILFIIVIIVVYNLLVNYFMKTLVTNRFTLLLQQIRKNNSDLDTNALIEGNDELAIISKEVNMMALRIKKELSRNKELTDISNQDSLTNLYNRRWFDDQFTREWQRAQRSNDWLSIIMIDVDFFKEYNDRYGHVAGDKCLQLVSNCIELSTFRQNDITARYGGEEFVCLLPHTDKEGAHKIACDIKENVEKLGIAHESSLIAKHVTVSLGCYTINGTEQASVENILEKVDALLYQSKDEGRNKISVASDSQLETSDA